MTANPLDFTGKVDEEAVKLIESAAKIGAQAGDQLLAAALGLGGAVDTYG